MSRVLVYSLSNFKTQRQQYVLTFVTVKTERSAHDCACMLRVIVIITDDCYSKSIKKMIFVM
jgi:hypothetical protein